LLVDATGGFDPRAGDQGTQVVHLFLGYAGEARPVQQQGGDMDRREYGSKIGVEPDPTLLENGSGRSRIPRVPGRPAEEHRA